MVKKEESVRKCSQCGNNGHNSRTCNENGCLKLFGVTIVKSFSMGNLQSCNNADQHHSPDAGYLSDGLIQSKKDKALHERKKGVPWTEEEHRTFLIGLKKLGKGDWRGISKTFVHTRTPTQVASHAQKYFLRQSPSQNKKRRSSLFDMPFKEPAPSPQVSPVSPSKNTTEIPPQPSTSLVLPLKQSATSIQAQVANPLPSQRMQQPPVLPMAPTCGIRGIPYMVGVLGSGLVPMMNFCRPGYGNFATRAPVTFQYSPDILVPQSLPHASSQPDPTTLSTDRDGLELKIAPPQHPQGGDLSSLGSGTIRVI